MKLHQIKTVATLLLLLFTIRLWGQTNGKVTGVIKDAITHEDIPFATITIADQQGKTIIEATQTDVHGGFVVEHKFAGAFTLRVTYVGYDELHKDSLVFDPAAGSLNLGTLFMSISKNNSLMEVKVTAKKTPLQNSNGKKVFAVNQSLVSKSGTLADLLQNIPTLQIDASGKVVLRGSTGVKVLIDGKPTVIGNGDVAQILQSIPASAIESIEVITNPSAKYDAEGQGIINVVLKRNGKKGFNAAIDVGTGTRENYNGSANISYQSGRINLYGNYSLKNGNTFSSGIQNMTFLKPTNDIIYSNELFPSVTRNKIQFLKTGFDYVITAKSTLGVSVSINSRNSHRDEVLSVDNLAANNFPLQLSNRYNTTNNNGNGYELSLDYSQHFKKPREELTFNFSYAYGRFNNVQKYQTHLNIVDGKQAALADTPLISDIRNKGGNFNIQADYVLPVGKAGLFSAGYSGKISPADNDQYAYSMPNDRAVPIYAFTSFFKSNNQVHAIYLSYQDQIANFSYQLGLRAEDAPTNATFSSFDAANSPYTNPVRMPVKGLYPSVLIAEKLGNNSQLSFAFANRVLRPNARQLNSATDFSDPVNYETGNPGLTPERIYSLELGYNKTWRSVTFTSSLYRQIRNNVIKSVENHPVDGIIVTTSYNLKRSTSTGLELIGHFDVTKNWDFIANANIFRRQNDAAPRFGIAESGSLTWNANITNNVTVVKRLSIQFHADYRAADMIIQDWNRPTFGLDAGARYDFPGNRASLSFNSIDVLNTRKWAFLRTSDDLLLDFQRRTLVSRATFGFSYRFGRSTAAPQPPKKKEEKIDKRIDAAS